VHADKRIKQRQRFEVMMPILLARRIGIVCIAARRVLRTSTSTAAWLLPAPVPAPAWHR
jgi:hypothetical protein